VEHWSVLPTGYGPRRYTAHTVRTVGEPVGVCGGAAGCVWGPRLYDHRRRGAVCRHPGPGGRATCCADTAGRSTGVGPWADRRGGRPRQHGAGTPLTRLTRRGGVSKARGADNVQPTPWRRAGRSCLGSPQSWTLTTTWRGATRLSTYSDFTTCGASWYPRTTQKRSRKSRRRPDLRRWGCSFGRGQPSRPPRQSPQTAVLWPGVGAAWRRTRCKQPRRTPQRRRLPGMKR